MYVRIALGAVAGALVFSSGYHALPAKAATESVVYSFCSQTHKSNCADGQYPAGGLIDVKGVLYGTTSYGGNCSNSEGTVFSLDPETGRLTILHSFCKSHKTKDGTVPYSKLTYMKGTLYGTTLEGGGKENSPMQALAPGSTPPRPRGRGTVFSIDLRTGSETILHRFQGGSDGAHPYARLVDLSGTLYGTTLEGGSSCDCGTVFSIDPTTGTETILHSFKGYPSDGAAPYAGLNHVNGTLYGTTEAGGAYNNGAVLSLNPETGAETVLHSFDGTDGYMPLSSLVGLNSYLYGTTLFGGPSQNGVVFSIDPKNGAETVLYDFTAGGDEPSGALLKAENMLYGTTEFGGDFSCGVRGGCGTVYSIDLSTGTETLLYSFGSQAGDGQIPLGGLIEVNGTLYGTTYEGGAHNGGTVFAITP